MDLSENAVSHIPPNSWEITHKNAECFFTAKGSHGRIYHLFVPESLREQGLGSALLTRAVDTLRTEADVETISIQVRETNGATESFLQKHGFSTTPHTASDPDRIVIDGVLTLTP